MFEIFGLENIKPIFSEKETLENEFSAEKKPINYAGGVSVVGT